MNYHYQVYKVNHKTGLREKLLGEGNTKNHGIDKRTRAEQKMWLQVHYGGTSVYMKAIDRYPTIPN